MGKLLALKTAPANRAALIDEFGDISKLRKAFAPTEARHKQLQEEIKTWHADDDAATPFTEKGRRWQLDVSACSHVTVIDNRATYKKLGLPRFLKAVTITLKALKELLLTEPEISELTSVEQIGFRSLVATPLVLPPAAIPPGNAVSDTLLDAA
jgi:hypothetical protein